MKTGTKLTVLAVSITGINAVATLLMFYLKADIYEAILVEVCILIVSVLISSVFISHMLTRPVEKLIRSMKEYKSGAKFPKSDRIDEIGQLQNSFSELTCELADEKAKQNRIIASISHDIKTPLTSVLGYTEFLRNPNLSETRRLKYINTIYSKALEIKDIVIEFDDYLSCNLDSNLDFEFITVDELLTLSAKEMREEVLDEGLTIVYSGCDCGGETVYIDKSKIHRVFMNIVTNAVKHSGNEKTAVTFSAVLKGEFIEIAVTDDGNGAKPDDLIHLFEPMYTTDRSRSVAGLGLAICREIILSHGGDIRAESEVGKYFSVCFTLKRAKLGENTVPRE